MKTVLRTILMTLTAISIFSLSGCKKGADGKDGKDGSANVTSHTFSINSWQSNSSRYYADLPVGELTTSNINTAAVQVYWGTVANNWIALPYTYVSSPNNYFMGYLTAVGTVEVRWTCNSVISIGNDANSELNGGSAIQIKVVVIPPAQRKAHPNVNWNNYQDVKNTFNLKD